MKRIVPAALVSATVFAAGAAFACDDMRTTGDGDGYQASKAPDSQATAVDKAAPLTVKQKAPVKQKSAGKPIAPGSAVITRTGG